MPNSVLFVLPQRDYGGLHRLVEILAPGLRGSGIDASAVISKASGALTMLRGQLPVLSSPELEPLPRLRRPHKLSLHWLQARKRAQMIAAQLPSHPRIVHTFGFTDLTGPWLARATNARLVRSANSSIVPTWADWWARRLTARADGLLFEGSVLQTRYAPRPNHLPTALFYPAAAPTERARPSEDLRRQVGIRTGAAVVGTWSNITPQKDLGSFIRYAAEIARRAPEVDFVIAGRVAPGHSAYETALRSAAHAEPSLEDRFHFVLDGGLNRETVFQVLDVVAQTSVFEGVATSTVEALAAGLPVVAHDVGSVRDLVETDVTGALIQPADAASFASAVVQLVRDPASRVRLGEAGRHRVTELCTADRLVEAFVSVYSKL